ncbi:ATP-NAD kinase [Haloarchaeobius amylolyticus]|uniref:ATP-NAD kinase n=1 Tax=Haloarchaeobius amylolyticus TaxID=1198296 RepID=UPI002271DBEF|nr:ATP-NAD kinase [Haloarchaeobius amylolyticus]
MDSVVGDEESSPSVGVAGEPEAARVAAAESAVADAGGVPLVDDPATLVGASPSFVVALGESALLDLVRAGIDVPVLPVDAGRGVRSVPNHALAEALQHALGGEATTESRRCFDVTIDGEDAVALFDVTLVTAEPARISEYAVRSRGDLVSQFRADGVVVSTPTGSHGYAKAAGGPTLEPGTGTGVVVPIAPFAIQADHWVVADDDLQLSVERDEGTVSLRVDDRALREVGPAVTVSLSAGPELTLVCTAESGARW